MSTDKKKTLTPKMMRAVFYVLTADTLEQAARLTGVTERTLRRWRKLPAFKDESNRISKALADEAINKMLSHLGLATNVQINLLNSGRTQDYVKAAICRDMWSVGLKIMGLDVLPPDEVRIIRMPIEIKSAGSPQPPPEPEPAPAEAPDNDLQDNGDSWSE